MKLEDLDEELRKKIENKQKCITTNSDLSTFRYHKAGLRNGKQRWVFHISKYKSVETKVKEKQKFIKTNGDLSQSGYTKAGHHQGIQVWVEIEYSRQIGREKALKYKIRIRNYRKEYYNSEKGKTYFHLYYLQHKELYLKRGKKWRENHKEKMREYARKFRNTPYGKLKSKECWHNHYNKGFVPLFVLNNQDIKIEWHHLFPDLPFVIPIPADIHQGNKGKNHYIQATQAFYKWLMNNPDIKIMPTPKEYKPRW